MTRIRNWILDHLARALHAAWRDAKVAAGHRAHEVNGIAYDLKHHWHELKSEHRAFDRDVARRLVRRMFGVRL